MFFPPSPLFLCLPWAMFIIASILFHSLPPLFLCSPWAMFFPPSPLFLCLPWAMFIIASILFHSLPPLFLCSPWAMFFLTSLEILYSGSSIIIEIYPTLFIGGRNGMAHWMTRSNYRTCLQTWLSGCFLTVGRVWRSFRVG